MTYLLLPFILLFTGCSFRNLVTPSATVTGAAVGSVGGPGGAALGAATGYAAGKIYELSDENEELVEAIDARKDSMGCATRGEVLSGLMSWMLKDPRDDGSAG